MYYAYSKGCERREKLHTSTNLFNFIESSWFHKLKLHTTLLVSRFYDKYHIIMHVVFILIGRLSLSVTDAV